MPGADAFAPHRARLDQLGRSWLAQGAASFALLDHGRVAAVWGDPQSSAAAILAGCGDEVELCVRGMPEAWVAGRLQSDAALLGAVLTLERDLDTMAVDYVENQDQLLALYDLTHSTHVSPQISDTLLTMARQAARLVHADGGFAALYGPDQPDLFVQAQPGQLNESVISALRGLLTGPGPYGLVQVAGGDLGAPVPGWPGPLFATRFAVQEGVSGALGVLNRGGSSFGTPATKLMRAVADLTGSFVETALLAQDNLKQAGLKAEAAIAHRVQSQLLPLAPPPMADLDVAALSQSAREVGGDFYDMLEPSGRPFTFCVGDVSGKGMSAAILMAVTRTALRTHARFMADAAPASILSRANDDLYIDLTGAQMFTTVFLGQYVPGADELVYANAGHSPVIFRPAAGKAHLLQADAPPLGVLEENLCADQRLALAPGDVLVVASDGLNESRSAAGDMFGYNRLLAAVDAHAHLGAGEMVAALMGVVEAFATRGERDDDQTVLVVKKR